MAAVSYSVSWWRTETDRNRRFCFREALKGFVSGCFGAPFLTPFKLINKCLWTQTSRQTNLEPEDKTCIRKQIWKSEAHVGITSKKCGEFVSIGPRRCTSSLFTSDRTPHSPLLKLYQRHTFLFLSLSGRWTEFDRPVDVLCWFVYCQTSTPFD